MVSGFVGQRYVSEREPELGLGLVTSVDASRITVEFPASGEKRIYAVRTPVLKRVRFQVGETVGTRDGTPLVIESIEEEGNLVVYVGAGRRVREDAISAIANLSSPVDRLLAGQSDDNEVFALRLRTLQARTRFLQSEVRGCLGGRLDLIPHQYYILHEVSARQIPRVLLADEVGLGKTIEACLILQRLLAVGKAKRVLILVPESLVHQWFVELLRRFNLWFSIYDEERCVALETSDVGKNPFLSSQLALCSVGFLAANEPRREQALAAGWDIVVVDEAHHLAWTPQLASPEYLLVEALAQRCPGLLLLTATPTQLGQEGHFARLRLLDPSRYNDYERFLSEAERFAEVVVIAEKIVEDKPLKPKDHRLLTEIFDRDVAGLKAHLDALAAGTPGARDALLKTLIDQHGTGRMVFRNTRTAMTGFPKRKFCPVPLSLPEPDPTLQNRIARELRAEESNTDDALRYAFKGDLRIDWLVTFLLENKDAKVLLICKSQRKVLALEAALKERTNVNIGLFHEGLPLVQRDRNAAWFAEPEGAQLLLCSEIGSEGRNFQFAHHLVLFDLPLNPGLLEQRIGRLDRLGQTQTIRIHVPYLAGSAEECGVEWYHRGLDAFEHPMHGGSDFQAAFRDRVLDLATAYAPTSAKAGPKQLEALITETIAFRHALAVKLKKGRDRLLELRSFDRTVAERVIAAVRAADADPFLRHFLLALLDHFGVRVNEHEDGDLTLDPSHAYIEGFPSIPKEGMLATFKRERAIAREDVRFLSADHPLVQDAIDLLIDGPSGTSAFGLIEADKPNLLVEAFFILEAVADSRWHVDQFLAPTPVRVLVDIRSRDLSDERTAQSIADEIETGDLPRFLEKPGFNAALIRSMVAGAGDRANARGLAIRAAAFQKADAALSAEVKRLKELQVLNDHVRPEEIELAEEQRSRTLAAIEKARVRLDSVRLIIEGPASQR